VLAALKAHTYAFCVHDKLHLQRTWHLTNVSQSGQTRTYNYDQLGRMTYETNPESGAVTIPTTASPAAGVYRRYGQEDRPSRFNLLLP